MRCGAPWALVLFVLLAACGDEPATTSEDAARPAAEPTESPAAQPEAGAGASPPADAPPEEGAAAKGGDEAFQPPPDWCGTPGPMGWRQPPAEAPLTWVWEKDGEELHVPDDRMSDRRRRELLAQGWTLKLKFRGWQVRPDPK